MKTKGFLALCASALIALSFSSCKKDNPEGGSDGQKSNKAEILSFKVTSGDLNLDGFIYNDKPVIEIACPGGDMEAMKTATAVVTLSDKATISPDPAEARDYTVEGGVKYTVTAEDGTTKVEYTVTVIEAQMTVTCDLSWNKTYGQLGLSNSLFNNGGIAFSGKHIVTHDGNVFDLSGESVGKVNLTGVEAGTDPAFQFACLSNDENGVLVGSVGITAEGGLAPNADGVKKTYIYAWMDGYDKAPTLIRKDETYNFALYMSVAGDVKGKGLLNYVAPVRGATQMHHVVYTQNGNWDEVQWAGPMVNLPSNDGNWGQMISFSTGDPFGPMFICDSRGNNQGMAIYYREGVNGTEDTPLNGTLADDALVEAENAGNNQYGNYSTGHIRAFTFEGKPYVVVSSSGWPSAYITIQPADANSDYILRTQVFEAASCVPCSAYYEDPESGKAYVAFMAQSYFVALYEISVAFS